MYTVIAVEGIDRIGKSTFLDALRREIHLQDPDMGQPIVIEKPSIGINNLKSIGYPLQNTPGIMEIRNIGLMEEFLYRCEIASKTYQSKIIIRDRFNLSELAYGAIYRFCHFRIVEPSKIGISGLLKYRKWNAWFENELDKVAQVFLITFVLDKESYPNEDEAISAAQLVRVNDEFRLCYESSNFKNKMLIELHKDSETGMTNIMDYVKPLAKKVLQIAYPG